MYDSFVAAIDSFKDLKYIEKVNYLYSYFDGEAFLTIQDIKLTDKNYPQALEVLRRRYSNKQRIISAHMNELLNMKKVERDRDLQGLRRLNDDPLMLCRNSGIDLLSSLSFRLVMTKS